VITLLDKNTNMRLMQVSENSYLTSMRGEAKMIIDAIPQNEDVLLRVTMQETCKAKEFVQILDHFSSYYFSQNPEVAGLLMHGDEDEMLEAIGFKPLSEESPFLYKSNIQKNIKGKGEKIWK